MLLVCFNQRCVLWGLRPAWNRDQARAHRAAALRGSKEARGRLTLKKTPKRTQHVIEKVATSVFGIGRNPASL